jgi:dipeptidyl aminopeptidase/acylaminoacyl peptidase
MPQTTLSADALWSMARVGAPTPAPDGRWALVPVTTYDLSINKGRTRLWRVSADGGEPRPLTAPDVSSDQPAFSPDGRSIVFVRRKDGEKPQLYRMPVDGGEAEKLTDLPLGAADPKWFSDGQRIVFVAPVLMAGAAGAGAAGATIGGGAADAGAVPTPAGSPPEPDTIIVTRRLLAAREAEPVKARVTENRLYRFWDRWITGGEVPHLFALDLGTKRLTDLIPDSTRWWDFMESSGQYDLAPDGTELAFSADASRPPHGQLNWDIFTVALTRDADGGTRGAAPVNRTPDSTADDHRPRYSPDGRRILYGQQRDPHFYADRIRMVLLDRATGAREVLTETWDRSPGDWSWSVAGDAIWLTVEDGARQALFTMPPRAGATPETRVPGGLVSGATPDASGGVWFTRQDLSHPAELFHLPQGGAPRAVTRFNAEALETFSLGRVEEQFFTGAGGARVQMFVVYPPGFDPKRKWPLVHAIHGGPHGIFGDQWHWRWNAQAFAAPGYIVALVNFHGSTSFGQEFAASIQGDHATKPFADILAATDHLVAQGFVDETRMAAIGGSYGGYLVTWIAGHTDRFRCLVNHAGVYDILSQYASDVTQGRSQAYGGEPWDGLDAIDRANPARYASGFTSPMLILHGDNDYRVPYTQGLEVYGVYTAKGVPARLVSYPDENHWILSPANSRHWYGEVLGWLARYLEETK